MWAYITPIDMQIEITTPSHEKVSCGMPTPPLTTMTCTMRSTESSEKPMMKRIHTALYFVARTSCRA